jgi:predicted ATP-grasp superfamily ATP-dependent carboligase
MMPQNKVLILDAGNKNGLTCIRSLGEKGFIIGGSSTTSAFRNRGFYSKYCKHEHILGELKDRDSYAEKLLNIVKENYYDVLIPVGLTSYLAVSKYKEAFLKHTNLVIADWDAMQIASNKDKTMEFADKLGIPIPETTVINSESDISHINKFPVVIKSSDDAGSFVKYANDSYELTKNYNYLKTVSHTNIIVQEYIKGFGCGFYGVYKNGELKAHFMHKRLKEFPLTGGPSAMAESYFDDELFRLGKKLMDGLKWNGPVMVEFKYDLKDKRYKLMEVNPKLWGSLDLTIAAGVDVPKMLVDIALGNEFEFKGYNYVKYKWLFPDMFLVLISQFDIGNLKEFFLFNSKTNIYLKDIKPNLFEFVLSAKAGLDLVLHPQRKYPHGKPEVKFL